MSIRHIVFFRRQPTVAADAALEKALTRRLAALGTQIPNIENWKFAANELDRPIRWDYVLEAEVADVTALDAYLSHPLHQALVAELKPYFELAVVDYTV